MKTTKVIIFFISFFLAFGINTYSQQTQKKVSEMTKDDILALTYDDLLQLSFEDLIAVANKFGMSADELLEYFLNKDVTSASKRAEKSLNSPLSSTVISREEIENSGATSIPEVLRLIPGMIIREKTPGNYDVHIRGNDNLPPKGMFVYSENSISLVMIDGRPVYNYAFGGTFWETLPIELNDIERIEVIRGPSSALYGPNAVSGAISIFTRKVENKGINANGHVQAGSNNSTLADASVSLGITDKIKVRLSGNYTYLRRFEDDFFVFDYNKKFSAKEMDTLTLPSGLPAESNFNKVFDNPELATDKYGANAFISYEVSKKFGLNLSLGTQNSEIISNTLGNSAIPIVPRTSNTSYIDFRSNIYGFQFQVNYMSGDQDVQKTYQGWHIEPQIFNSSIEYEYSLGTLVLRPGISFQNTIYDDSKWGNASLKDGFLNGPKTINSFAYYLRADYKIFDKLRLIGALRGDKYNKPDKTYPTFQFISSYDINNNNVIRAVYSRANRGPFISDTYANYFWQIIPGYYTLHYEGNQNLNLPVMDMFELGYRTKISKNIMLEVEAFHTIMKDIVFWTPDELTLHFNLGPMTRGQAPNATPYQIEGHGQYQNMDLKSTQDGLTCNINVVVSSNLNFKVFGTLQQTKLSGFYPRTIWNDFTYLQNSCGQQFKNDIAKVMGGDLSPLADTLKAYTTMYNTYNDSTIDITHKSTPSFYGGFSVDYKPIKSWNINSSIYLYSKQTMLHNKIDEIGKSMPENINNPVYVNNGLYTDMYTISPKVVVNLKVAYKFYKENSVFINARNLFSEADREFAFLDKVNGLYLLGLSFNF